MPDYNKGLKYNTGADADGFNYNGKEFTKEIRVVDSFDMAENTDISVLALVEEPITIAELISTGVFNSITDVFSTRDQSPVVTAVYHSEDNFYMSDTVKDIVVGMQANDNFNLQEKAVANVWLEALDEAGFSDEIKRWADTKVLDEITLEDLHQLFGDFFVYDEANLIDKEAKKSISDFYITKDTEGLYDIIMPFNLIIDWKSTKIPFMPEAKEDTARIAGADGDIWKSTVYEPRLFEISAVTFDGLEIWEKEEIKARMAHILYSIKNKTATITFGERETTFDIMHVGLPDAPDHPGWVEFNMTVKSHSAWGRKQFEQKVKGNGLLVNEGDDPCGFVTTLTGPWNNPTFTVGDTRFAFNLSLAAGETLVVDTLKMLCHYKGKNAVPYMTAGDLSKKIPVGSVTITAPEDKAEQMTTTYQELVLY